MEAPQLYSISCPPWVETAKKVTPLKMNLISILSDSDRIEIQVHFQGGVLPMSGLCQACRLDRSPVLDLEISCPRAEANNTNAHAQTRGALAARSFRNPGPDTMLVCSCRRSKQIPEIWGSRFAVSCPQSRRHSSFHLSHLII